MAWPQNLSVLLYIELFVGTLRILNHRILMMEYYSTNKRAINQRKIVPFVKKLIYKYIILNCNVQIKECCKFPLMPKFYF